ncbi:MAG: ATP-binding protein [Candidatus Tectomicrobia bacterium]|uniref:ATP-binding protein n=1 Tax=Tectimicrobiota bacterium TaxID=2528274 RepID=A0A933GNQ6_UNCTE|nr:ATP-binding protein [Candidatus Tectomicrobia bacterium]
MENSLKHHPIVGLLCSRQVGKTTLARMIEVDWPQQVVYLDLELPSDQNKLQDAELYLGQFTQALVIIDEIQRMPSLFPLLRALVDQSRTGGRFLLLGSASPALIKYASESLAGRIIYHELTPLTLQETGIDNISRLWLRGGYPKSYLSENDEESFTWREAFIKTYLEMDIPHLGVRVPSIQLRRFWTMLAHAHGQLWNASQIANSLGISAPTVRNYLDILEETFIVRQLQPYHFNIKKRLIKSPRVFIRDSGLLHALLRTGILDELQGHPVLGSSWEGFIVEQVLAITPKNWPAYFYRTNAGAEIDLLLLDARNRPVAIEIKYSTSPKVTRGFWSAYEDLGCERGFIIYPGEEKYPLGNGVFTLPARSLDDVVGQPGMNLKP